MTGAPGRSGGNHMPAKLMPNKRESPKKPSGLSKPASNKWDELVKFLPDEYLAPVDVYELKILCNLLCQSDTLTAKLDADPDAESSHRLYLNVCKAIHQLSAAFGLNPADRERLGLNNDEDDTPNELEEFLNREGIYAMSYTPPTKESAK